MRDEPESVQPALRRAEAEVVDHLREACAEIDEHTLSEESLDELLRLEDELLAAARALDETVRLRRRLGDSPKPPAAVEQPPGPKDDAPVCRLRDFTSPEGKQWRVWEVKPGSSGRRINPERYLGEYVKGWLAFECPAEAARRRLPNHPVDWFGMTDADLGSLLPRAVEVQKRTPKAPELAP